MFRQTTYNMFLVAVSLGISLLVCELVLRMMAPTTYYIWRPGRTAVTNARSDVMPGISGRRKHFTINDRGIRGDAFSEDQEYRILAIGGSTTECFFQDDSEAWPYLLQERLSAGLARKVWVGSLGQSGQDAKNHIMTVKLQLDQYPRIDAIVVLVGINDFLRRLAQDESYRPSPGLDNLSRAQYERYVRRTFQVYPSYFPANLAFYERTEIAERVRRIVRDINQWPYRQEPDGSHYARWRSFRRAAPRIRPHLPDLAPALDEYARDLTAIIVQAKERGVRPVFLTQPTMWRSDLEPELLELVWMGGVGDYSRKIGSEYYAVEALAEGMGLYNDVLRRVCKANDVDLVDLDVLLPKDLSVFFDDCHFNDSGCRNVAAVVADYLLREGRLSTMPRGRESAPGGRAQGADDYGAPGARGGSSALGQKSARIAELTRSH